MINMGSICRFYIPIYSVQQKRLIGIARMSCQVVWLGITNKKPCAIETSHLD